MHATECVVADVRHTYERDDGALVVLRWFCGACGEVGDEIAPVTEQEILDSCPHCRVVNVFSLRMHYRPIPRSTP